MQQRQQQTNSTLMILILTISVMIADYVEAMILPAIPVIQREFDTTATLTSWTTTILLIVGTAATPLFGRLGDIHGKKKMFLLVLGIYTSGVGIAVVAPSIYILLFSRAIQAVGLSLAPLALAIVADVIPKEQQARAQGLLGGSVAISTSAGYVLGALVVQEIGWRYGFFTVLIPSMAMVILVAKFLTDSPSVKKEQVDYSAAIALGLSTVLVLLYLTEGSTIGWVSTENLVILTLGVFVLTIFLIIERKTASPLIDFKLLKARNVLVSNSIRALGGVNNFLFYYAFVYFAESPKPFGLGLDVLYTGLILAPATFGVLLWAILGSRILPKVGPKPMIFLGSFVWIVGFLLCIFYRGSILALIFDGIIFFAGMVIVLLPQINMISVSLPKEQSGIGMSVNSMLANFGQSFGPVLATTIMVSFSEPLTKVVNEATVTVGSVPSSFAFDLIFITGIVIIGLIIAINAFTQNYKFPLSSKK